MTAPLTTTTILTPTAPATSAAAPPSAETPAGFEFQPVLAALTQAETAVVPPVAPAPVAVLPAAVGAAAAGNPLPPGGDQLPQTSVVDPVPPATTDAIALPVGSELPGLVIDETPAAAAAVDSDELPTVDSDAAGLALMTDAAPQQMTAAPVPVVGDESSPAPATAADATASTPTAVVTVAPPSFAPTSAVTAPVATPAVAGAVKRLLPESAAKNTSTQASTAAVNTVGEEGQAGARTTPAGDMAATFDLAALTGGDDVAGIEQSTAPTTTATSAVPPRENPLRAYQSAAPIAAQVDVPVGRQGFSEAVLEKVMWFSSQQIGSAEIHLNPAELGPLSVRISTHQDQASVYFTSHHASVRDAVDQALPRLREMFDSQGIQLLDAGVGEQRHARQQAGTQGEGGAAGLVGDGAEDGLDGSAVDLGSRTVVVSNRLLDAYA